MWAYLRCVEPLPVHQKRMWRVMRAQPLLVPPHLRLRAKRTPTGSNPRPTKPHAWWGIEMPKALGAGLGGIDLVVVLDWDTQKGVGS
jgi:putative transposase